MLRVGKGTLFLSIPMAPYEQFGKLRVNKPVQNEELEKAQEDLELRIRGLEALQDISQIILTSPDLKATLMGILDGAVTIDGFELGAILLADPTGTSLEVAASYGYRDPACISVPPRRDTPARPGYRAFKYKKAFLMENSAPPGELRDFKKEGVQSAILVPVNTEDATLGFIQLGSRTRRRFDPKKLKLLEAIGNQVGVAIQKARLYEKIKKQAVELEQSNKVKSEFLSVISHELRTPLTVAMGYTAMLHDGLFGDLSKQQQQATHKVLNRSNDLLMVINSVLEATKIETGAALIEKEPVDLKGLLSELTSAYNSSLDKRLNLISDYPADLPVMKTDGAKLRLILQNLIHNAIKFTAQGTITATVRYHPQSKNITFQVADTGIGIPKQCLPLIFEKFYRVDSSETRRFGGVGLGLYIVKTFSEMLEGKVEVESEPGKGSTFTVTLPCERSHAEVHGQAHLPPVAVPLPVAC